MELKIKEVCRKKKIPLKLIAKRIGISRQALDARIKLNPKWSSINEIAEAMDVNVIELIVPPPGYIHFYIGEEWMGISRRD